MKFLNYLIERVISTEPYNYTVRVARVAKILYGKVIK
jgi:hypothetical protein